MSDTHTDQAPAPTPPPTAGQSSNGLATAGFVLGLLGLLGSWVPLLNIVAIGLGVLGAVLAAVGFAKSKRAGSGRGLAIAGLIMGVLAVVVAVVVNAAFVDAVDQAINDDSPKSTVGAGEDSQGSPSDDPAFMDGVLTTDDIKIDITRHQVIAPGRPGNEYGDKPVIAFWYSTTNISGDDIDPSTAWIFHISAFQDNNPNAENELEIASLPDDRFLDTQTENIKKGGTVENAIAYELDDQKTPVDLVASDTLGFDELGTVTYQLK